MRLSGPAGSKYVVPQADAGVIVEDGAAAGENLTELPGAVGGVWGAWTQMDASLAQVSWICSVFVTPNANTSGQVVEIGMGAGGSESTIIRFSLPAFNVAHSPAVYTVPIPIKLAATTRVAGRTAKAIGNSQDLRCSIQYYNGL